MPSALETLVKILKLEREQGYKNAAVYGGLAAYRDNWMKNAHAQARKPEHHLLVDELADLLQSYENLSSKDERHNAVSYMLDRITGRAPMPPQYSARLQEMQTAAPTQPAEEGGTPERGRRERNAQPAGEASAGQQRARGEQRIKPARKERERPSNKPRDREDRRQRQGEAKASAEGAGQQQRRSGNNERNDRGKQQQRQPVKSSAENAITPNDDFSRLDMDAEVSGGSRTPAKLDIPVPPRLVRPPRQPRQPIDPDKAADIMRGLNAPVERMKGIGPKLATLLNKMGIYTINDLLFYLPRRYDDYTRLSPINRLQPNQLVTVIGTVRHTEMRIGRNARKDFFMVIDDGTASMGVTFFGQFYLQRQIRVGQQLALRGETSMFQNRIQMTNPEFEYLDAEDLQSAGIVPVYPLTEGMSGRKLRQHMKPAIEYWADYIPDYMPETVLERAELADLGWTLKNLHFPESQDHLEHARRRYIFDQLLMMQLTIMANRRTWQSVPAETLPISDEWLNAFVEAVFPYPLTGAQRRAIEDIRADIAKPLPMNRLLQGDVGSGKTAVAATALAMAVANGKQAALMAPTSILAEQHYRGISATLAKMPGDRQPKVALLTGSLSSAERDAVYAGLADGSIDIVIGTHALIQQGVEYKDLALAVIDEQHRFGVEQRGALRGKGKNPHLLVMTATPIPRTLALTLYADLDLSIIDEMPPGRIPIRTRVIDPIYRERAYNFVEAQLEEGRQAFIVYPLVEASETIEAESAVESYDKLKKIFYQYKVGLLHGRMKPEEKDQVMNDFRDKKYDVLVTTSVAEVGVDIPNASVIVIDGANRFGLAQLHQFRGRVGRGGHASYCLLVCDSPLPEARQRLEALEATADGFKLAEIDWQLRGPGDLIGTRQSGVSQLKLVEAMKPELVELAQREAKTIFEDDPLLEKDEYRLLAERIRSLQDARSDVS